MPETIPRILDPFPSLDILDKLSDIGSCIPLLSENGMEFLKDLAKDFDKFSNEMNYGLYVSFKLQEYLYWRLFKRPYTFEDWKLLKDAGLRVKKYGEK